jgi:hypothetical protein
LIKLRQSIDEEVLRWNRIIASASNSRVGGMLVRDRNRWLCRNDLYYLGLMTGHIEWDGAAGKSMGFVKRFHQPFCDVVSLMNWQVVGHGFFAPSDDLLPIDRVVDDAAELGKARRLFLKFRSAYKSTIVTKLHIIQLLLNFPEIHICISHNTQINASDILISIKKLFMTTKLRLLFPECIPNTKDWGNNTGFSLGNRKDFVMTGDNVEAIGINTEVIGRKFHVFKNDDIVTDKSVTNEEQLRQSIQYVELHKSLFVNPSVPIEDYSDTTYHFADATVMLQADPDVQTFKQEALKEDVAGDVVWQDKRYSRILPEHHSIEGLGKEGVSGLMKDPDIFNLQYMLNPSSPRKVKFTKDMICTYDYIPEGLNFYLLVDPADSEEKRACYTAMKVIGIGPLDDWYWVDGIFDKIDDRERIDAAIMLARKWNVFEVLWENLSFGRTDQRNFELESRKVKDRTWTVRPVGASHSSKDDRILGLNDRYSRRKIFWPPKLNYYSKFEGKVVDIVKAQEYEFLGFPLVSHKDLLDAESFLLQVDVIPGDKFIGPKPSEFAHIKDPIQRGNAMVFRHDWETWKENGFNDPSEVQYAEQENY